ncbi:MULTISPECIES: HD domain-containing protein [Capnocytophaga]|uniref:HD domain-containing protein n=1 Tax=Capnocytophaga canis TaxID=1848903 RepID=A0A0B7IAY5_9FLAO|nr:MULTISPECIES: HD domain-containing protein [Capnocytophaga]ATA72382.1 HD domain-containing protein [Capnocytophaga sp. H4358]ATA74493.1 HD domain-containing protein [Capnocytophaga sp. H2931]RIY35820.1 HD domain-containing protein [Capnocytophaga canis]CEN43021.1 HD domain-containing protein 2 [Capnocytophaga canis]CEN48915.1 HD domain-containing protein 2 [Capnocytophaga canis]
MELAKELEFILTLDKLKNVQRRNYNLDDTRRENSAEHSWQVMVLAQIMYPYAKNKEQIDLFRVMKMLSIHDIVEIDAGDTFVYDEKAMVGKYERELASAKRIFGILGEPLSAEFLALWEEFESGESADAIFASAVDRIIPFILNAHTSGKSWREAKVSAEKVRNIVGAAVEKGSEELTELFEILLQRSIDTGKIVHINND